MKGKVIANIIALFVPSKRLRHKLRRWKGFETNYDRLQKELDYIKNLLKFSVGTPSAVPQTGGFLRTIQLVAAEKMKEVDAVLKEAGIDYWLDFGGLLGSVRHGGFIPWDDDLDIAINYDDKKRLIQTLQEKGIEFDVSHGDAGLIRIACMPQSEGFDKVPQYGVHIDVFSYKKMTSLTREDVEYINKKLKSLRREYATFSAAYHRKVIEFLDNYKAGKDGNLTVLVRGCDYIEMKAKTNPVVPIEDVYPLSKCEFEGVTCNAPNRKLEYLADFYGNFMDWPPVFEWGKVENMFTMKDKEMLLSRYAEHICKKN